MSERLLTTRDVADILEVTDETIRRWAAEGRIRHVRLPSGQIRFEPDDIADIRRPVEPTNRAS
jgi:excisionase family DNA binding protein